MNQYKPDVSRVADTLVSQASIFNCTLDVAWKEYMHPAITDNIEYNIVKKFIDDKVALGELCENEV